MTGTPEPHVIFCRECERPWGVRLTGDMVREDARAALIAAYRTHADECWPGPGDWLMPDLPAPTETSIVFVSDADNRWLDWLGIETCADSDTWYSADDLPEMPKWWSGFKRAKPALRWDCCKLPHAIPADDVAEVAQ